MTDILKSFINNNNNNGFILFILLSAFEHLDFGTFDSPLVWSNTLWDRDV